MSEKYPITEDGYKKLTELLIQLKSIERPKASQAIAEAREHGDLSENAEYDAAKEAQGLLEARIRQLEMKLALAQVIDISKLKGERVIFGSTVKILDLSTGKEFEYSIVGDDESDPERGLISYSTPLAKALIGKEAFDIVEVVLPSENKDFEILSIEFKPIDIIIK